MPRWVAWTAILVAAPAFAQLDWVARASGQTRALNAVAWTGKLLAVVGENGVVSTSPDGMQWTKQSSGSNRALHGVAGQDSLLVAVGANGTILRSSNGGSSWQSRNSGTSRDLYGVLRTSGQFIAVGSQGILLTSPDGLAWASRPTNTSTDLNALAWNGSRIVAVGDNGVVRVSLDGVEWADGSVNTSKGDVDAIVWTGSLFTAMGENRVMLTSSDGMEWTSVSGPGTVLGAAWDGSRLVAVGTNGGGWISPDGNAWSSASPATAQTLRAVTWTGSRLVAAGAGGVLFTAEHALPSEPPQAPTLTSPEQFAQEVPLPTKLRWEMVPTALRYRIQVSRVPDFSSLVHEDSSYAPSLDLPLSEATEYFWRVRALNAVGAGAWSEIRVFKTVVPAPRAPVLLYPAPFAEDMPVSLALRWERTPGATSYSVQLSRSPDFASLVASAAAVTDTQWAVGPLEGNTAYFYWRVRAVNTAGAGEYSSIRRFATGAAPAPTLGLKAFTLHPASRTGGTRLRFTLEKPERVVIRLLDTRGRQVAPDFNRRLESGAHEIPIVADVVDAGYLLDVRVGNRRRETILLRP